MLECVKVVSSSLKKGRTDINRNRTQNSDLKFKGMQGFTTCFVAVVELHLAA